MSRTAKCLTNYFDKDDTLWVLSGTLTKGDPGSYYDPPEADDIEILTAEEELDPGFEGPCRKLSFDDFVSVLGASDADVDDMHCKMAEEAAEFDGDDERQPDYDDVHPEYHDALDRFDTEY